MKYILKGNKPCRKRCLEPNSITSNGGSYRMITEEEHDPYDHISFNEAFGKTTSVEEEFERFEVHDEEMGHCLIEVLNNKDSFFERLTTD